MKFWSPEEYSLTQLDQMTANHRAEHILHAALFEAEQNPKIDKRLLERNHWLTALVNQHLPKKDRVEDYPMKAYYQPILELALDCLNDAKKPFAEGVLSKKICISVLSEVRPFFVRLRQAMMKDSVADWREVKKISRRVVGYVRFILEGDPDRNSDVFIQMYKSLQRLREDSQFLTLCRLTQYIFENYIEKYFDVIDTSVPIVQNMTQCYDNLSSVIVLCGQVLENAYPTDNNNNNQQMISATTQCIHSFESAMLRIMPRSCVEKQRDIQGTVDRVPKMDYTIFLNSLMHLMRGNFQEVEPVLNMMQNNGYELTTGAPHVMSYFLSMSLWYEQMEPQTHPTAANLVELAQLAFQVQKIHLLMRVLMGLNVWPENRMVVLHVANAMTDLCRLTQDLLHQIDQCVMDILLDHPNPHPDFTNALEQLTEPAGLMVALKDQLNAMKQQCFILSKMNTSQLVNTDCQYAHEMVQTLCVHFQKVVKLTLHKTHEEVIEEMLCQSQPKRYLPKPRLKLLGFKAIKEDPRVCGASHMAFITRILGLSPNITSLDFQGLNLTSDALEVLVHYYRHSPLVLAIEEIDLTQNPLIFVDKKGRKALKKLLKLCVNVKILNVSECDLSYTNASKVIKWVLKSSVIGLNIGTNPKIGSLMPDVRIPMLIELIKKSSHPIREVRMANIGMKGKGYQAFLELLKIKDSIISYCVESNVSGFDDIQDKIFDEKEGNRSKIARIEELQQARRTSKQGVKRHRHLPQERLDSTQKRTHSAPTMTRLGAGEHGQDHSDYVNACISLPDDIQGTYASVRARLPRPDSTLYQNLEEDDASIIFFSEGVRSELHNPVPKDKEERNDQHEPVLPLPRRELPQEPSSNEDDTEHMETLVLPTVGCMIPVEIIDQQAGAGEVVQAGQLLDDIFSAVPNHDLGQHPLLPSQQMGIFSPFKY